VRSKLFARIPDVVNQLADMGSLLIGKTRGINQNIGLPAQKRVGGDDKKIRHLFQQLHRGLNIIVFPVGNALLGNAQPFGQTCLRDTICQP